VNRIQILNPRKVVFGPDSLDQFVTDFIRLDHKRLYLITIPQILATLTDAIVRLESAGVEVLMNQSILDEPDFDDFYRLLDEVRAFEADGVVGIGGGSVMDTAKLLAAKLLNDQTVDDVIVNGFSKPRTTYLACIPTTSGTGSEVSPNAIFVSSTGGKVGVISPELVPDAAYIDPALTESVPPSVTASTGIDALAHCIEAYTNKFAHPVIDLVALEGIRLIGGSLKAAYDRGNDAEARSNVALGSMYGGMCLGPVNTAAAHALAYPLSTEFNIPHGLSVALLLPHVMEYNLPASVNRYADVAVALGAMREGSEENTARLGISRLKDLIAACGLPSSLADVKVPFDSVPKMAESAVKIQRLLKNNPREISVTDAEEIYTNAFNNKKS
jgi:alcohol dehydrogenase class IV